MAVLDDTSTDLRQTVAALEGKLGERTAERDEALAEQTAMAEVLQVINSSPGDLGPVFDAILEKALRLCEAAHGHIWRIEGQYAHAVALRGDARFIEAMRRDGPAELVSRRPLGRIARGEHVVHMPDATKEEVYRTNPAFREFIDRSEIRTGLMVALRKDEALLGAIVVHRKEVLPFTDKQIGLLQNFAAQAVIAMENARLLTELRERTQQLAHREAELSASEERYALVSQAVAEGIYDWDIASNALWVSPRLMQIFGWDGADLSAADWNARVNPEDFELYRAALRACFKAETPRLHCEYRIRLSDGTYR
jgi:GAF domain-containing protein